MEDSALTVSELLAALHDIRLPSAAPGGFLAEALAALGLALLAAALINYVLQFFTKLEATGAEQSTEQLIAATENLSHEQQSLALLHLLGKTDPKAVQDLEADLYTTNILPKPDALKDAILSRASHHD